ncbi:baseplate protein [Chromobacterium sp. ATCC 53434]|uniref:baseplate assembly protein n=1 Tax=Chromobacterium sp. (strain ATCC 53434 / SC 14030) TaxID=2059672 RepID=UPI000C759FE5|nr:baseplate J/gp47 family protein [Chromobacterium sp. ATCC 53434]AUH51098.1 baseplate protein [Chromobacterium sp. ATCC 53434]
MTLPAPEFIARDPDAITAEIIAQYEQMSGKTLYPAQVERLLIDLIAYRETLVRVGIQEAAKQNLVAFARAPMLDYLGQLVGVTRLPAQPARAVLRFSLDAPLASPLLIPAGTRVESGDGVVAFATDEAVTLPVGSISLDAAATCQDAGITGNGWQTGQIVNLMDDLGDMDVVVTNTGATAGGVDEEDDERLRERITLAPESFSNAGSVAAYRFHALRAHQNIVDVAVLSPTPGVVQLYPLLKTGLPDANMLALVQATCSAEKVRPLTDRVEALAPAAVDYVIEAQLKLFTQADAPQVCTTANQQAAAYAAEHAAALGRDIVPSQIIAALQVTGVYEVTLVNPPRLQLAENEWARCIGIKLVPTEATNG